MAHGGVVGEVGGSVVGVVLWLKAGYRAENQCNLHANMSSWHLVVMTTAHSSKNLLGIERRENKKNNKIIIFLFYFKRDGDAETPTVLPAGETLCV